MRLHRNEGRPPRKGERGFSMVEMMIAITMLGVGILSLAGIYPLAMGKVSRGDVESRATFHAQAKIEELKAVPWDNLLDLQAGDVVETVFTRTWQIQEDTPVVGMKQIQVTVAWTDNRGPRTLSISSLLSDSGM